MTNYGTPSEIAASLDHYNEWRRGGDGRQPDSVALGRTIEAAAHALRDLERQVKHWKSNHATEVRRARILKERTDMPMERTQAYEAWGEDQRRLAALDADRERMDWIEQQATPGMPWVARQSMTMRGFRLHQDPRHANAPTARAAIDEARRR